MGSRNFREAIPSYIELYKQGRLKLDELLSAKITLDDVNEAFDKLSRGEVMRSVITFN
jgi:Zn-dependent alcohol dehydrogenase